MYMDDIKLFAKNEKKLEIVILTARIYSQDKEMEFGLEKCAMIVMKSGKWHITEEFKLPNQEKIRTLGEKETYKWIEILEADIIKQVEMKEIIKKEYLNQKATRDKTILQEPYQRDLYLGRLPRKIFGTILEVDQRRP